MTLNNSEKMRAVKATEIAFWSNVLLKNIHVISIIATPW